MQKYRIQIDYEFSKRVLGMYSNVKSNSIVDIITEDTIKDITKVLSQNDGNVRVTIVNSDFNVDKFVATLVRECAKNGYKVTEYFYTAPNSCDINKYSITINSIKKLCEHYNQVFRDFVEGK